MCLPEEPVGKAQHLLPVVRQHGMFARTDMIAYVTFVEGLVDRWQRVCANAFLAIQGIDSICALGTQKLAFRVAPLIVLGTGHIHRAGRDERDDRVLVEGHTAFTV